MKNYLLFVLLAVLMATASTLAHHAADSMVDEEIYANIDEMVSDMPHATLDLDDLGGGSTEITVSTRSVQNVENMIDDGLLDYASMLDGDVTVLIEFDNGGGADLLIAQTE